MAYLTYDQFEKKYLGKAVDYDGTASIQCVDIVDQYLKDCFGITGVWVDGAKDLYNKFNSYPALVKAFNRIPNTDNLVVKKGDIIVWGGGSWGHTGIGDGKGDKSWFMSLEENTLGQHEPTQLVKHYFANDISNPVLGVLRPKNTSKENTTTKNTTTTTTTNSSGAKYTNSPLATKTCLCTTNYNDRNGQKIDRITVHHMAGNLTIEGCKSAVQSRGGSANYAIQSDGTIGLLLSESKRSWCSSSPDNDYRAVTIECANAPGAGEPDWKVTDATLNSIIKLCADICKRNGIPKLTYTGQLNGSNLTMHKWFAATGCPGKYLGSKFPYIVQEVNKILNGGAPSPIPTPAPSTGETVKITNKNGVTAYTSAGGGNATAKANYGITYTITEKKTVNGQVWGKLKSGAGWICLTGNTDKYPANKKSVTEVAKEVIAGKWGNGAERQKKLEAAGYNYTEVQNEVNRLMKG